jgi:hypothetical protein
VLPPVVPSADCSAKVLDLPPIVADPSAYPVRAVVIVAVEEVPGATPVTVTRPVLSMETVPLAVAVPAQV